MRKVTCTSESGDSIVFSETAFSPFLLAHIDGIYDSENVVSVTDYAIIDGGQYQGSRISKRNIVLTVSDKASDRYDLANRDILRKVLSKGLKGTLIYTEDDVERSIDYYVESIKKGQNRLYLISLICPDPYFYDKAYTHQVIGNIIGKFEFPHIFKPEGEELGQKIQSKIINIVGVSYTPLGLIMRLTPTDHVKNPSLINITTGKRITLGETGNDFDIYNDDIVEICTEEGKMNVTLERNGAKSYVNQYITEDSEYWRIEYGTNFIGYNAEQGKQYLTIEFMYRNRYEGA